MYLRLQNGFINIRHPCPIMFQTLCMKTLAVIITPYMYIKIQRQIYLLYRSFGLNVRETSPNTFAFIIHVQDDEVTNKAFIITCV